MGWSHGVPNMRSFTYNFSKFALQLNPNEIKGIIITVLISSFVFSFNQWGDTTFDFVAGMINFISAMVIIFFALVLMMLGQRIMAVYYGYDPEYEFNLLGLLISLVIAFASRGTIVILMPGYTLIHHLAASRLGEFRYYPSSWEWAKISFIGLVFNFGFALFVSIFPFKTYEILGKIVTINLMFAIYGLIPLPQNPGFYMFFTHKNFWAFGVGFLIGGAVLIWFTNPLIAAIGSFLTGVMFLFWWFFKKDKMQGFDPTVNI